eukprot:gene16744-23016_t
MDVHAAERDKLNSRAEKVSSSLMVLGSELHGVVGSVNELSAVSMGDPSSPVGAIVRILNNQLQALTQESGG